MKRTIPSPWAITLVAASIAVPVHAADMPAVEFGDAVVTKARVAGVDRKDRVLWLQGSQGNVAVVEVSDAVKNFKEIKVDDELTFEYYEAVAFSVGAGGEPPEADAGEAIATAPKGMEPGGVVVEAVDVSATIEAIDQAKRTLTIKGPEGNVIPLKVDKSVKVFDQLKVGEAIHAKYAKAFAISISAP